jgi:hypothetical protein
MRGMTRPKRKISKQNPSSLVGAEALLREVWPDEESRPSLRWLRGMQAKRLVPFRKIGRKVYFDPSEVRRTIDTQFKVESLG